MAHSEITTVSPLSAPVRAGVEFIRYTIAGCVALGVDILVLLAGTEGLGLHYLLSAAAGFAAGVTASYAASIYWVFEKRNVANRALEFQMFVLVGIVGLALTQGLMWSLTELAGWHYTHSKLFAAAVVYLWNFSARKLLLFK